LAHKSVNITLTGPTSLLPDIMSLDGS